MISCVQKDTAVTKRTRCAPQAALGRQGTGRMSMDALPGLEERRWDGMEGGAFMVSWTGALKVLVG